MSLLETTFEDIDECLLRILYKAPENIECLRIVKKSDNISQNMLEILSSINFRC